MYINKSTKETIKYTYSIIKTYYNDETHRFEVCPAYDFCNRIDMNKRQEFIDRALQAAFLFPGKRENELREEFEL